MLQIGEGRHEELCFDLREVPQTLRGLHGEADKIEHHIQKTLLLEDLETHGPASIPQNVHIFIQDSPQRPL